MTDREIKISTLFYLGDIVNLLKCILDKIMYEKKVYSYDNMRTLLKFVPWSCGH